MRKERLSGGTPTSLAAMKRKKEQEGHRREILGEDWGKGLPSYNTGADEKTKVKYLRKKKLV